MAGSIPRFPAQFIARPAHQRFCHQPACFGLAPQEEIMHGPFALPPSQPIYVQHRQTGGAHFLGSSSPMRSRVLWITASPYSSGWLKRTELCGRDHAPAIRVLGFLRAIKTEQHLSVPVASGHCSVARAVQNRETKTEAAMGDQHHNNIEASTKNWCPLGYARTRPQASHGVLLRSILPEKKICHGHEEKDTRWGRSASRHCPDF